MDRDKLERDLFLALLELSQRSDVTPVLEEALRLIVGATGAARGYIELHSDHDAPGAPQWSMSRGCSPEEVAVIRSVTSKCIVAMTLAGGETIHTPSALVDERFATQESVREGQIESVICTPLDRDEPIGVLYLQSRTGAKPFTEQDVQIAETFAQHAAPVLHRVLQTFLANKDSDKTAVYRSKLSVDGLIGKSEALAKVFQQLTLVAPLDVAVLLTGASGTGKSQLARAIHDNSPRRSGPFVDLNCAAIPETLMESELFGALPGSHSAATHKIDGKVTAAEHGTLLLDEIGDLPPGAQAKLLQLLQSHQYYPLGANKPLNADIRIIAATNADLGELVRARKFREDLYYRLNVIPIRMPSVAERKGDLPILARHFLNDASHKHNLPQLELSPAAERAVATAEWPGNIRELANALEASLIRAAAEHARTIEIKHVFPAGASHNENITFQEATRRFQKNLLEQVLAATSWNVVETARRLDLTRSHVYNLIHAFGLTR